MATVPRTAAISSIRGRLLGELDLALRRNLRGLAALAIDRAILVSGVGIGTLALDREHQAMAGALANRAAVASGMRAAGERWCAENGRPRPSPPRLMSGRGSSHCRHLGTTLFAPPGCGYNANPKIPAEEAGRGRKLHRRVHHVLRWAVGDRRWLWTAPKSFSGSVRSAAVVAAGREAFQMDGTAVDFDRDSARVRGAILAGFRQRIETLAVSCSMPRNRCAPRPCA